MRLPTPDCARSFCSRMPLSLVDICYATLESSWSHHRLSSKSSTPGRNGASDGRSSIEVPRCARGSSVEVPYRCARVRVAAPLLDQAAVEQRSHDAVDVDASDRRDPAAGHRLPVGDDRQRLEGGLCQPGVLSVAARTAPRRRERLAGVEAPPTGHVAQLEAAPGLVVLLGERGQRLDHRAHRVADGGGQDARRRAAGRPPSAPPRGPVAASASGTSRASGVSSRISVVMRPPRARAADSVRSGAGPRVQLLASVGVPSNSSGAARPRRPRTRSSGR